MAKNLKHAEITATFESSDSAIQVTAALNEWFIWLMEGAEGACEALEDLGVSGSEYSRDIGSETDWVEPPQAEAVGNIVTVSVFTAETLDLLEEMLESLGAFEIES